MDIRQIEQFFKIIDDEFNHEARVILTGAAAGTVWGSTRPSMDVDFAVSISDRSETAWQQLEASIQRAIEKTGIQANYAEDIDRWGMITLLDYKSNTKLYKQFGSLALMVLDPAYWSIDKMTRFIDPDIQDMIQVFRKKNTSPHELAEVWGTALKESPRSTTLMRFRRQVEGFFESYGRKIWGNDFNSEKVIKQFHKSAGIKK
ncbi:MAG: hypothetical protein ISR96_13170 [Nitrospira sp.]|nr:hypothetical protein [bacterium]MBL7050458.1 hypothetical protein [Nitrospira sp.]